MNALLYASVACLMFAVTAKGHGGGLDELGCHNDRREGNYHCHRGPLAGKAFRSKGDAKREWRRFTLPLPPKQKRAKKSG